MFKSDTVFLENVYFYRYSVKPKKIDDFPDTTVIHRKYGSIDEFLAFVPGKNTGTRVDKKPLTVTNFNGTYFYVWNSSPISEKKLHTLFLKAAQKYFGDKIQEILLQQDKYKLQLKHIEEYLKS